MDNNFFHKYPYTDFHEMNLDWILSSIKEMMSTIETFVSANAIKYADPIAWSITSQYEKNTVVIDSSTGTAYLSVSDVPSGISLSRTEYWTVIFDLSAFISKAAKNFANTFEDFNVTIATQSTTQYGWVVIGDTLYRANTSITPGDAYTVGGNVTKITIEDVIGKIQLLNTTDKSNLVNAINEVLETINSIAGDLAELDTSDKDSLVAAINEVNNLVATTITNIAGDLGDLNTVDKSNLVAAINELVAITSTLGTSVGNLANLQTTAKNNLVAAINELVAITSTLGTSVGNLANLQTTAKNNLVAAINELVDQGGGTTDERIGNLADLHTTEKTYVVAAINSVLDGQTLFNATDYVAGDGTTDDTASFRALVNMGSVYIPDDIIIRITGEVTIPKGRIIVGTGKIIVDHSGHGLTLDGDNVVKGIAFEDTGAIYQASYAILNVDETSNVNIVECNFSNIHHGYTVLVTHSVNVNTLGNVINGYSYAGLMYFATCSHCDIMHNRVINGRYTGENRYGIVISGYSLPETNHGPAEHMRCDYNYIEDDSPLWEAIDSHGMRDSEIIGNTIRGTQKGIEVGSSTSAGAVVGNNENIIIANNDIETVSLTIYPGCCICVDTTADEKISNVVIANNKCICSGDNITSASVLTAAIAVSNFNHDVFAVKIADNYIESFGNGITIQDINGEVNSVLISGNYITGITETAAYQAGISLNGIQTSLRNCVIENNQIVIEAGCYSYRGTNDPITSPELVTYRNNSDNGTYFQYLYSTVPLASAPGATTKAKGKAGDFIPCTATGLNIVGWFCVSPGNWKSVAGTAI